MKYNTICLPKETIETAKKFAKHLVVSKIVPTFALLFLTKHLVTNHWRDGRVVDYNGLENRRAERHRGFESLSLR